MPPETLIGAWTAAAMPPPTLTISEWADERRYLPQSSAARGTRWRTEKVPYLAGIMNAPLEPGVRTIAVKKCHQVGGSEALHNIVGYFMEYDPCPMLFVQPTENVAEEWSKERLADMLLSSEELGAVVREEDSTLLLKLFMGGFLALGGANTPNTFARRAVRLAIGDDVDRWPPVVGDEGDPADLLRNRTTTFLDALAIFVSTPTLKDGRIDTLYERSDRRRLFVECPACGREDWITWSDAAHFHVGFDDRDPDTARLECPEPIHGGCGAHLFEPDRRRMVGAVTAESWRPTATPQEVGLVGFHLPAMVSLLGNVSLPFLVETWLGARAKGRESLRVFINTWLAEAWEDRGAKVEPHTLESRRESYGAGVQVPLRAVCLTCGVDVQADRFEYQVFGWAPGDERWVIDYQVVRGDPKLEETQTALVEGLRRRYVHALGPELPIHATCVDTGSFTTEMYDFVLAHQQHVKLFATKGFGGRAGEPIVGKPSKKEYGRTNRPIMLFPINTDDAKGDVMGGVVVKDDGLGPDGPGRMHFADFLDAEYFAQLCAEHKETRYNKSRVATHTVWVQDRDRNEALDTAVLALAAYRLLLPIHRDVRLRQMAAAIEAAATQTQAKAEVATMKHPPTTRPPQPPTRRVSHSNYLRSSE